MSTESPRNTLQKFSDQKRVLPSTPPMKSSGRTDAVVVVISDNVLHSSLLQVVDDINVKC